MPGNVSDCFSAEEQEPSKGRSLHIALIECEANASEWLADRLRKHGFLPKLEPVPGTNLSRGDNKGARAILIDLGPLQVSAANLVRNIRRAGLEQPCLVLSSQDDWREKIECLDAGADDFVVKPVRSEEIAARLRALIRRSTGNATDLIECGNLKLDLRVRCAWLDNECLNLTRNEFRLLSLFLLEPDKVMTHDEIRSQLYPERRDLSPNAIEVQIARLRRKVGRHRIRTIRRLGYRYVATQSSHVGSDDELCTVEVVEVSRSQVPDHLASSNANAICRPS